LTFGHPPFLFGSRLATRVLFPTIAVKLSTFDIIFSGSYIHLLVASGKEGRCGKSHGGTYSGFMFKTLPGGRPYHFFFAA
jgi:hypothetical protein